MLIRSTPRLAGASAPSARSATETYLHNLLSDVAGKELHRAGLNLEVKCQKGERPFWTQDGQIFVDPSLLKTLNKKEEMAFVLAQQASLLMTDADPTNLQLGADQMAFEMMSQAGMNPAGGYSALEKLYSAYPTEAEGDGLSKAVKSAASGQEHEGIRVAFAHPDERLDGSSRASEGQR